MIVASAGKPRLPLFFIGLLCVIFALVLVLYLYSYTAGLASHGGYTILESNQVAPLFVFMAVIVLLGTYGGYEIGRFIEAQGKKKTLSHEKQ
jgi:uncharacterized membrane protein